MGFLVYADGMEKNSSHGMESLFSVAFLEVSVWGKEQDFQGDIRDLKKFQNVLEIIKKDFSLTVAALSAKNFTNMLM